MDILEVMESKSFSYRQTGIHIPSHDESNLCVKAFELLQTKYELPPVKIHLHKLIPVGAGLGGGSSDAAVLLKALNILFELGVTPSELETIAAQIGSDCPFFIHDSPKLIRGRGHVMENISIDLNGWYLVVVDSQIHISTAEAYQHVTPRTPEVSLKYVLENEPVEKWTGLVTNDFEPIITKEHPEIYEIHQALEEAGSAFTSMTGSGSAIFGLFREKPHLDISYPAFIKQI